MHGGQEKHRGRLVQSSRGGASLTYTKGWAAKLDKVGWSEALAGSSRLRKLSYTEFAFYKRLKHFAKVLTAYAIEAFCISIRYS